MQCLPYLQGIPPAYKVFFAGAREDYIRSRKRSPTPSCSSLQTKRPSSPARSSGSMAAKPPRDHSLRHACRLKPHRQRNSPMTQDSQQTAPTQFAEANGIRFAYRRFGNAAGVPLVFMQHFRGGMDHWDPTVTDGFAEHRPIILFDNAGVAASTGETPDTIDAMSDHAADFIGALGLAQIDLLGFSIGAYIAQTLALRRPQLIRRLILAGTGPRAGEPSQDSKYGEYGALTDPETGAVPLEGFFYLFFRPSEDRQAAARAFWARRHVRKEDVDPPTSAQTMAAQRAALTEGRP